MARRGHQRPCRGAVHGRDLPGASMEKMKVAGREVGPGTFLCHCDRGVAASWKTIPIRGSVRTSTLPRPGTTSAVMFIMDPPPPRGGTGTGTHPPLDPLGDGRGLECRTAGTHGGKRGCPEGGQLLPELVTFILEIPGTVPGVCQLLLEHRPLLLQLDDPPSGGQDTLRQGTTRATRYRFTSSETSRTTATIRPAFMKEGSIS